MHQFINNKIALVLLTTCAITQFLTAEDPYSTHEGETFQYFPATDDTKYYTPKSKRCFPKKRAERKKAKDDCACYGWENYAWCDGEYYVKGGFGLLVWHPSRLWGGVVGIGNRLGKDQDVKLDFSLNFGLTDFETDLDKISYYYAAPRIVTLFYMDNAYFGGGMSWGGVSTRSSGDTFHGLFAEGVIGWELACSSCTKTFFEINFSQAVIPVIQRSGKWPNPVVYGSFGFYF